MGLLLFKICCLLSAKQCTHTHYANTHNTQHTVYKGICKRSRETVVLKSYTLSSICELYQHQIYRCVGVGVCVTVSLCFE